MIIFFSIVPITFPQASEISNIIKTKVKFKLESTQNSIPVILNFSLKALKTELNKQFDMELKSSLHTSDPIFGHHSHLQRLPLSNKLTTPPGHIIEIRHPI